MPVVAVGAAIFAGATMATVGIAAMSTISIIGAVGAIAAGVGVITGNKALTQIGAIAGLVGGVGAFAQSSGWLGSGGAGIDSAGLAGNYTNQMDMASDAAAGATREAVTQSAPGMVDPSANLAGASPAPVSGAVPSLAGDAAGTAAQTSGGLMNSPLNPLVATDVGSFGQVASVNAAPVTSASIFDSMKGVGEFMNKNKDLTSMGMKFVQGMFDETAAKKAEAESAYLGAKTSGELLNQEQQRQQMANMNAVPDLTGLRVNPAAKIFNPGAPPAYNAPRAGLMNSTGR